jgi:hypothetical protein
VLAHARILATIETDPTRYHGENALSPTQPDRAGCEQVLAHLAADLTRLFPEIARCSLAMPGAVYDQTQVIRPGFPLHAGLEAAVTAAWQKNRGHPLRLAIGCSEGHMPDTRLQPDPTIPPGLLQNLPLIISGEPELIETLSDAMEHQFLEQGQLSAHSAKGLESNFGIAVTHARFMTLTDLLAMLRLQLEHFEFLPLWDLLDAAIDPESPVTRVTGRLGQAFECIDGSVHAQFETFDYWAREGSGKSLPAGERALEQAYADWTREYRQYITTLNAHAITVHQHLAGNDAGPLEQGFLVEESDFPPPNGAAEVTEHSTVDLGVIAVTVVRDGRQFNYYPLSPAGLNKLHASIRAMGLGPGGFSYPGNVVYDPEQRCLSADEDNASEDD